MKRITDQQIKRLVRSTAGLSPVERNEYLDRECGDDAELRRSVEEIVREEADLRPTQVFADDYADALPDHYTFIEKIGSGGMGEVVLAMDTRLDRKVAVKFLNREFTEDPDRLKRFHQEARSASALDHPNIITIHDIGENRGVQFIVSEFVDGETLSRRISRGKVPIAEAVDIAIQISSALAATHHAGIIHRDIKPENVMLRGDGNVKVLDFGLAKATGNKFQSESGSEAKTRERVLTSPGLLLGTPQYMSPEQARGSHLDARTDIFSLGIILFEMVTGVPPFFGDTPVDIIASILNKEPRMLEQYLENPPLALISIVKKALRKRKEERYSKMDDLLADLKDLKEGLVTEPDSGRETAGTPARTTAHNTVRTILGGRFIYWEAVLILIVAAVLASAAWWYSTAGTTEEPPVPGSMKTVGITSWSSGAGELVAAASFSPDSRMVAFGSARSGSTEIWVKPTVGGESIPVTKNGFYNQYPIWSPNGQDLAYFSSRGDMRGIWRASFTGGEQIQIAGDVDPAAKPRYWAKSGKIYFQGRYDLFAANEVTGEITRVTDFESRGLQPRAIEVSADESRIAFSIKEDDLWKIKVKPLDADSSEEIAVSNDQIDYLAWHPSGKKVIFSGSVEGAYQIFEAGPGGGVPVQLSNGNLDFFVEDVSNDGTRILYGSMNESSDLWMVNTQDAGESLAADDMAAEYWADFSPDGKTLAYQSVTQANRVFSGSINIKPLSGSGTPLVVASKGFSPVWSNNGERIAFFRRTKHEVEIWSVRPTGDDAGKLADGGIQAPEYTTTPYLKIGLRPLSWSPDDSHLAYSARKDGISNIWLVSSDGLRDKPVTENQDSKDTYCCPAWTPDGKFVVFSSESGSRGTTGQKSYRLWVSGVENSGQRKIYESNDRIRFLGLGTGGKDAVLALKPNSPESTSTPESIHVYLISLETGSQLKVSTLSGAYFYNIHLSPDGRSIAFVSRRDDESAVWILPVSGGSPRTLIVENDPKVLISSLSWSRDGKSIVFGRQSRSNLLSMLVK